MVRSVLGRLAMSLPDHVDHDDLSGAGLVGLLQALRNDPACGGSFETYARLQDAIREHGHIVAWGCGWQPCNHVTKQLCNFYKGLR